MQLVSNLIFCIHVLLVLFIIVTPFIKVEPFIMLLHCFAIPSILLHWTLNDNTCCLTLLEQAFRKNCSRDELFFHRLVGPVYKPQHNTLIVIGMLLLMMKSCDNVYNRYDELTETMTSLRLIFPLRVK